MGVDIDGDPHAAFFRRPGGEPGAQESLQVRSARRPHEQPEPVAAANDRNRRLGGSEKGQLVWLRQAASRGQHKTLRWRQSMGSEGERPRMGLGGGAILARHDQRGEPPEGGQTRPAPLVCFLLVKALAIARQTARA